MRIFGSWRDFMLYVGPWACRITFPHGRSRFGNGSRWCSGWHRWPEDVDP